MDDRRTNPTRPQTGRAIGVVLVVLGVFVALCGYLIHTGRIPHRVANDQILYHEATIRLFAKQWPDLYFSDYYAASTPGYHVLLALVARYVNPAISVLQWCSVLISLPLLGLVARYCGHRAGFLLAVAFCLPLALSVYVIESGAWLLPDNLGWLCVTGILLALFTRRFSPWRLVWCSLFVFGTVWSRQSNLWLAGLVWIWAWLPAVDPGPGPRPNLLADPWPRFRRVLGAIVLTLPAFATAAYFYWLWGGLTPPRFVEFHQGINLAAPAFMLAIFGVVSGFFGVTLAPPLVQVWRFSKWRLVVAAAVGLAVAVVPATTHSVEAGRYSGLWELVRHAPALFNHTSPVIAALSVVGAVSLVGWLHWCWWHERTIMIFALIGMATAQAANINLWQRYVEPFVLIVVAILATRVVRNRKSAPPLALEALGPSFLAVIFLGLVFFVMHGAPPMTNAVDPNEPPMGGWELHDRTGGVIPGIR